jgi:RNA polymerase sigma-54 factor
MKPGYGLELVQSQKLALTPELRQAIMVLQMNALELLSFVRQQVEENPLLDLTEDPQEEALPEPPDPTDEEWLAYFCDSSDAGMGSEREVREGRFPPYEAFVQRDASLKDHLFAQLGLLEITPDEYELGEFIIGNLDDNGYLRCSPAEISLVMGRPKWKVEAMLRSIQRFDPPGVGARDLRECLATQARALGVGPVVSGIIDGHLEDLARGRYRKIAKEMRVSVQNVMRARDAVLRLDPKPGAQFSCNAVTYVYPEVSVRRTGEQLAVSFNDGILPHVRWNSVYRRLLTAGEPEARAYLHEQLRRARALLRSIEQRKVTMLRVMDCIVSRQADFFHEGPGHVGPLTMREVAQELGMHESTVSRCVSNKYVDTPFGIYPCKTFFSPKVRSTGEEVSQYIVKKIVQALIQSEDPRDPLVDQEIMEELYKRGVHVARRTVAKYRAQLGIQPSSRRKVP